MGEGVKREEDAPVGPSEDTHWRGGHGQRCQTVCASDSTDYQITYYQITLIIPTPVHRSVSESLLTFRLYFCLIVRAWTRLSCPALSSSQHEAYHETTPFGKTMLPSAEFVDTVPTASLNLSLSSVYNLKRGIRLFKWACCQNTTYA
jgi:hypothetical protein